MQFLPTQQPSGEQFVPEEKKQELLEMIRGMKEKLRGFRATRMGSANKQESLKKETLNEIFNTLMAAGVDLTDQSSVSNFILDLRQKNPELAEMFENAMDALLGKEDSGYVQDPSQLDSSFDPTVMGNNMNIGNQNEVLPKNQ